MRRMVVWVVGALVACLVAATGTGAEASGPAGAGPSAPGAARAATGADPTGRTAAPAPRRCALPTARGTFGTATPAQQQVDPRAVRAAIRYAQTHLRASVQIFRHNCRIGQGLLDPVTDQVPNQVFSVTKSVVSLLTGIARDRGYLALDDPIGRYLPLGLGDRAHRAITIRDLLTETSGLDEAIFSEFATTGTDPDIEQEALAQPLVHEPGTHFAYSQRTPDLLAAVVQRAVGQPLQTFAQRHLFGPIGIPRTAYTWLEDRSGHTYGYAHLFLPPAQLARLGLLVQNDGRWRGRRVVSRDYLARAAANSPQNPCYGFLFWHNGGSSCTGANVPNAQTVPGEAVPSAPRDMVAMVGALQQNNFMSRSLGLTVTWTGTFGDTAPHLGVLLSSSSASDLYYRFFRILMRGIRDVDVRDPGPYRAPPFDFDVNPFNYADPAVLLRDLAPNGDCTILVCRSPG